MGLLDIIASFFVKKVEPPKPVSFEQAIAIEPVPVPVPVPPKPIEAPKKASLSVNADQLVACGAARADAVKYVDAFNANFERFGINSNARLCAFIAQVFHESGALRIVEENLFYSAERLCVIFPRFFPTIASTAGYAKNPEAIANKVYGDRLGNDPVGDGWKYRGRGLIQLTGKANYAECAKATGLSLVTFPDILIKPENAVISACWFWQSRGLNAIADGDNDAAVLAATKKVNGGTNGLKDRQMYWAKAKKVFK